jgi:hypothetical protein
MRSLHPSPPRRGTPFTLFGYVDSQYTNAEFDENNNSFTAAAIVGP